MMRYYNNSHSIFDGLDGGGADISQTFISVNLILIQIKSILCPE